MRHRETDFAALARSMGLAAWRVSGVASFRRAIRAALATGRPALVDAMVGPAGYEEIFRLVRAGEPGKEH